MEIRTQNKYKKQKKKKKSNIQVNHKLIQQNKWNKIVMMDVPHLIILFLFLLQYKKDDKLVTKLLEDKARHKYINQML